MERPIDRVCCVWLRWPLAEECASARSLATPSPAAYGPLRQTTEVLLPQIGTLIHSVCPQLADCGQPLTLAQSPTGVVHVGTGVLRMFWGLFPDPGCMRAYIKNGW